MKKFILLLFITISAHATITQPPSPFFVGAPFSTPGVVQLWPSVNMLWLQPQVNIGTNFPPLPGTILSIGGGTTSFTGSPVCLNDCSGSGGGSLNGDGGTLVGFGGYGLPDGGLVEAFGYILLFSQSASPVPIALYAPTSYVTLLGGLFNFSDGSGSGGGTMSVDGGTIANIGALGIEESNAAPTMGRCTLSTGTCTVSTSAVAANSEIFLTEQDCATANAVVVSSRIAGTSFNIASSSAIDTCVVSWLIIVPN